MNGKMYGLTEYKGQYQIVDIFAYATQGLPGIEIIGAGKLARSLKEKVIYFTRWHGVKLPMRRYIVCLDGTELLPERVSYIYLELPFLLILWYLAGVLPIQSMDDCLAFGKLSSDGGVCLPNDLRPIHSLLESFCTATGEEVKTFLDKDTDDWPGPILPLGDILNTKLNIKKMGVRSELATVLPLNG
ncbi:MAG: hypothetical protein A2X86_17315 [Bdellovibrionales bacterium GWA2_49_15]|nr:MAG: hypothetical protein A2X86_17315 [Bdellovibrionales bacterium GWA2_49_15]HAZ14001.1 hypothetical protein [Bdellovibrionales bacterium]